MAKLLRSANILSGPANFKVPAGQYAGFMLRATGTNQAAQTLTLANLGQILATWRGVGFMQVSVANLNALNGRLGGVAENTSAVGAAFRMAAFIESSYVGDGNIFDITDDDDVYINVNLSGVTAAIVASGTIQLLGITAEGAQAYIPHVMSMTANVPASGNVPYDLPHDNIAMLFLNTLANVDRIQVEADRESLAQGTVNDLIAASNYVDRLETEVTTHLVVNLNQSRTIDEALRDDVTVTISATAGGVAAPDIVSLSYDFAPDVLARSKATLDNRTASKHARKVGLNKVRAVRVAQAVSGKTPNANA